MALVKRTYVDQTTIITADNLNDIQDEIIANGLNIEKHSGVFADEYSSASLYSVGDYCTHDNLLYKCNTAIAVTEDWNPDHWTAVTVGDELVQADWNEADNTKPNYIKNKPSIPVIDATLSTQGQAADAKATGDKITEAEQIMSYLETGNTASRNYSAGEYVNWKGVLYTVNTGGISSGASFVAGSGGNLSAVGDGGGLNSLKNTFDTYVEGKIDKSSSSTVQAAFESVVDGISPGEAQYLVSMTKGGKYLMLIQKYTTNSYASYLAISYNSDKPYFGRRVNGVWTHYTIPTTQIT